MFVVLLPCRQIETPRKGNWFGKQRFFQGTRATDDTACKAEALEDAMVTVSTNTAQELSGWVAPQAL